MASATTMDQPIPKPGRDDEGGFGRPGGDHDNASRIPGDPDYPLPDPEPDPPDDDGRDPQRGLEGLI